MKKLLILFPLFFILGLPVRAAKNQAGVQNQNQVQTQNQGEESQLQVSTQEQEVQNMSAVAKQVQQLLQLRTSGGIGEQVRQVAREQNQAQNQIQEQLNKLGARTGLVKRLFGPNYQAVKSLKQQLEQNQLRIEQLEQLQNQVSNQGDLTLIQETIQALIQENTSLQERITAEEQTRSLFGWLLKFLTK